MSIKIAITGGIGSGKSTVLNLCKDLGYPIYSCDEIYNEIICEQGYVQEIARLFPNAIDNGKINRKKLSEIVFKDSSLRRQLNKIAHPRIMHKLIQRMAVAKTDFVFAEVPLLFEIGAEGLFDTVIVVMRDKQLRIEGIKERDKIPTDQIVDRMNAQFDYDNNLKNYQNNNLFILENNLNNENLKKQLINILRKIQP